MEATKNICCAKGEDTVDHNTVTKWFKKFHFIHNLHHTSMIRQGQVGLKL